MYPTSNDCKADNGETFQFSYSDGSYGFTAEGEFHPFSSGGTDVSDTTATASTVRSGYYFYNAQGERTLGIYTGIDTDDATAKSKNIEAGYTAYVKGTKITGIAFIEHTITKYTGSLASSYYKYGLGAASIGGYALFAGGNVYTTSWTLSNTVEAFDINFTKSSPTPLSTARSKIGTANIGDYALFGGGSGNVIDAYNKSLIRSTPTAPSIFSAYGSNNSNYAIFADSYRGTVNAYNKSLTRSTATSLPTSSAYNSTRRDAFAATNIGGYVLFGGGLSYFYQSSYYQTYNAFNNVDAYNESLVKSTATGLSTYRGYLSATRNFNYALFGAGEYAQGFSGDFSYTYYTTVDAYNSSLSRTVAPSMTNAVTDYIGTSISYYALFAGGKTKDSASRPTTVDTYDGTLTKSTLASLIAGTDEGAATNIDNECALIAGGLGRTTQMDAYYVA